ncbi:unnamed protein product [Linum trigynum]|uniref:Retrotransposon gag domain-containing protein n=1 Tax=Linum trigynum TaxID=586398 RepID=A0AAV2C8P7_9ROSI
MPRRTTGNLLPLDPEIERTCRQNRKQVKLGKQPTTSTTPRPSLTQNRQPRRQVTPPVIPTPPTPPPRVIEPVIMAEQDRSIRARLNRRTGARASCVVIPAGDANMEITPAFINMITNGYTFSGASSEDPHEHLRRFASICDTMKSPTVSDDAIRLRMFSFSLLGNASHWFQNLTPHSITTWGQLEKVFLDKYFPPALAMKRQEEIVTFKQADDESLTEAWERYKGLLMRCPSHGLEDWNVIIILFNGIRREFRDALNNASRNGFTRMEAPAAYELVEKICSEATEWGSETSIRRRGGLHEIDRVASLEAKIDAKLDSKFDALERRLAKIALGRQEEVASCELCEGPHHRDMCPLGAAQLEDIQYINNPRSQGQGGMYSNTYNPQWRHHPNMSWSNNNPAGVRNIPPPGFQQQQPQPEKKPQLEELILAHMQKTDNNFKGLDQFVTQQLAINNNLQSSMLAMERQMGQMAQTLADMQGRIPGTLPANTERNPKDAMVVAVTLRSGKALEDPSSSKKAPEAEEEAPGERSCAENEESALHRQNESGLPVQKHAARVPQKVEKLKNEEVKPYEPPAPFPQRLMKPMEDPNFKKFVNIFKQLHINIPLAEALEQMPTYAKFLRELLTKKRKWADLEKVTLTSECSAVIQNKLPEKRDDPGSFTIPCVIGGTEFNKSLCDLGAGINLMPYSVYKKLGLGDVLKPTRITLQLADRSVKIPKGVVENVLVKVGKFILPTDFVILEMEDDRGVPLILGRPFLATDDALIDVGRGKLTFRVGKEEEIFNVFQVDHNHDEFESEARERKNPSSCDSGPSEELSPILSAQILKSKQGQKSLPGHLKYRYLGKDFNIPVIIPSSLTLKQEEYLLEALQYHLRLTKGSNMPAKKVIPNFRTPGPAEVTHMLDGGYAFYHCSGGYSGYLSIPIG